MHSQLDRSVQLRVWLFQDRFPVAPLNNIKLVRAVYRILLFGTIFRHVAELVTELSARIRTFGSSFVC